MQRRCPAFILKHFHFTLFGHNNTWVCELRVIRTPGARGSKLCVIRTSGGANSVLSAPPGVQTLCYRYQKGVQLRPTNVYFKKPFVFCRMLCFVKNQNRYPDILVLHRLANKQLCLNVGLFVRLHKPTNLKWLSLATTFTSFILNL